MADAALESALAAGSCDVGQVKIRPGGDGGYLLCHRDDVTRTDLRTLGNADAAIELARFDDAEKYRPLKTAPNLAHGWSLRLKSLDDVQRAIESFYPGRLAVFAAFNEHRLKQTPLRETLDRQSGMYRVAANISDERIDRVAGEVCRSDGGCLRTILWRKNEAGHLPSQRLPAQKFDVRQNQAAAIDTEGRGGGNFIPMLCQEACAVLIDACRKAVQTEKSPRAT
jgi:4Fe-4S iron-sulfur cluster binding domain/DR2241 stabilising domain